MNAPGHGCLTLQPSKPNMRSLILSAPNIGRTLLAVTSPVPLLLTDVGKEDLVHQN